MLNSRKCCYLLKHPRACRLAHWLNLEIITVSILLGHLHIKFSEIRGKNKIFPNSAFCDLSFRFTLLTLYWTPRGHQVSPPIWLDFSFWCFTCTLDTLALHCWSSPAVNVWTRSDIGDAGPSLPVSPQIKSTDKHVDKRMDTTEICRT